MGNYALSKRPHFAGTAFTYNPEFAVVPTDTMDVLLADMRKKLQGVKFPVHINPENRYLLTYTRLATETIQATAQTSRNETMAVYLNPTDN